MSPAIQLCALLAAVTLCAAQFQPQVAAGGPVDAKPVTEVCLGCICHAISGCDQAPSCDGDTCGLFKITWAYWADAGKPTLNGEPVESPTAYANCAKDPLCASNAVQLYMNKYGQDCNNDGAINCYDYMAIHKLGGYGCKADLPFQYVNKFNQCISAVAAAQQGSG